MKRLLLVLILHLFYTQLVTAQSDREILRLGRGTANALDWRPDGEVLAVGSGTGIWLYDENFEPLAHLEDAETGNVQTVKWSPEGDRLASANDDSLVQIWRIEDDGADSEPLLSINEAWGYIAWSPDGERIAGLSDSNLNIWSAATGELLLEIPGVTWEVAWSPDSRMVAGIHPTGNDTSEIQIRNAATGELLSSLQSEQDNLYWIFVAWSPDGTMVAGGSSCESSLHIWDAATGNLISTPELDIESQCLADILWSPEGHIITLATPHSGFMSSGVVLIDTALWKSSSRALVNGVIWRMALHPELRQLTLIRDNSVIISLDLATRQVLHEYRQFDPIQSLIVWSPNGRQIATAASSDYSEVNPVLIWRIINTEAREIYQPARTLAEGVFPWIPVTGLRWIDSNELITISESNPILYEYMFRSVERWNPNTGESNGVIYGTENGSRVAAFNSAFTHIAGVNYDGTQVEIRHVDTDELLLSIPMERRVVGIQWVQHDQALSIVTWNLDTNEYFVELWDSQRGEILNTTPIVTDSTSTGRRYQSPDDRFLAVVTLDDLTFLDASKGETLETISIVGLNVLVWSPDSARLALGMTDGTIRIWDVSDLIPTA